MKTISNFFYLKSLALEMKIANQQNDCTELAAGCKLSLIDRIGY